ncbi:MAG: hypothetical protein KC731_22810 [Myxococcales bacterium]|nr:hypothetical protein [Myxococcales bacterium]
MIADVVAMGARSATGLSSLQIALCARAHMFEPTSLSWRDKRNQPMGMALAGGLGTQVHGFERLVGLAAPALSEALAQRGHTPEDRPLPLIVGVARPGRPDRDPRIAELAGAIGDRAGVAIDEERRAVIAEGQAGFASALLLAKRWLDEGTPRVAVGGVDSYYHPEVLRWLDEGYRLQAVGAEDGFIPGEGAAFLLLERGGGLGRVLHAAVAKEETDGREDVPNLASATTGLLHALREQVGEVRWAISDQNGERARAREWALATGRALGGEIAETKPVWDLGDVGAASGPLFSVLALSSARLGFAPHPSCALVLQSDGPERGVVALESTVERGETTC